MKKFFQRLSIAAIMLLFIGVIGQVGWAQTTPQSGNGFRISPVRSELIIEKGKSSVINITIENPTDIQTTATAQINDFIASDNENGEPRLIIDEVGPLPKNSFKSLVQAVPDTQLGPREKKDIQVTVRVPENASAGGYYGAIRFAPSVTLPQGGNVGLTASVGTIVLVRVPGDLTERLDLVQLGGAQGENAKSFFTGGDVQILTRLKNTGDIHVQPFGKMTIRNMFGKIVHEYEFNSTDPRANILPESTRKFIDNVPDKNWFGRYTVEANIGYSQGSGELISSKASFWYIPTIVLYLIIALVLVAVAGVYWLIRKRKAKSHHKSAS